MERKSIAKQLAATALACVLAFAPAAAAEAAAGSLHGGMFAQRTAAGASYPGNCPACGGVRDFGAHSRWWTEGLGPTYPYRWDSCGEPKMDFGSLRHAMGPSQIRRRPAALSEPGSSAR